MLRAAAWVSLHPHKESSRWRKTVDAVVAIANLPMVRKPEAVEVFVRVYLERPASHYGTGRNASALKPASPTYPVNSGKRTGDADNFAKLVLDALSGYAYEDDMQIVDLRIRKLYADAEHPTGIAVDYRALAGAVGRAA